MLGDGRFSLAGQEGDHRSRTGLLSLKYFSASQRLCYNVIGFTMGGGDEQHIEMAAFQLADFRIYFFSPGRNDRPGWPGSQSTHVLQHPAEDPAPAGLVHKALLQYQPGKYCFSQTPPYLSIN
jgi:hypothetical protein